MNIGEIMGDAVRYPFSDWKKIFILGIIIVFTNLSSIFQSIVPSNVGIRLILFFVGIFLIGFFARGYQYRIIKSSLNNVEVLPGFDNWLNMLIDGIKVTIVAITYLVPGILISGFIAGIYLATGNGMALFLILIAGLYIVIFIPIYLMALVYMADNDSKLREAFRFSEILNKMFSGKGIDLIIWYIVTAISVLVLFILGIIVTNVIGRFTSHVVGTILLSLLVLPYIYMYLYRFLTLAYMSK